MLFSELEVCTAVWEKTVPKFLFASMFFSQTVFPIMVNNLFFSAGLFFSHFTTNVAVKKNYRP